jgi:hypothetical protein
MTDRPLSSRQKTGGALDTHQVMTQIDRSGLKYQALSIAVLYE